MTTYKLLALDMDGTLLDSHKHVTPRTHEAISRLAERGVAVAFSTGRCPAELFAYEQELPAIRYGSCASGALVYDFHTNTVLSKTPFSTPLALQVVEAGSHEDAMLHMHAIFDTFARESDIRHMDDFHMGVYQEMFDHLCHRFDDAATCVKELDGNLLKINFYHKSPEARDRTRRRLERLPLELVDAETTALECSVGGVSKAAGLSRLTELLNITLDEVVCIGDGENDREALKVAGCPVAMGNASGSIKALARLVVADNDHDGIAEAIKKLF